MGLKAYAPLPYLVSLHHEMRNQTNKNRMKFHPHVGISCDFLSLHHRFTEHRMESEQS